MATRIAQSPFGGCAERDFDLRELRVGNGRIDEVAVLEDRAGFRDHTRAKAEEEGNPCTGCGFDLLDGAPYPGAVDVNLHQPDRSGRITPVRL